MTAFTINEKNEILAFSTPEEAIAHSATPFDTFSNADELAQLATAWPAERLLALWNSVPGLTTATEIKDAGKAAKLIFKRLEKQGSAAARQQKPKAAGKAKGGVQAAKGAPTKGKATKKDTPAKNAPKAKKAAKAKEATGPREGSKMAQVIAMLQRKNGATLDDLARTFTWEKHTVRGMIAGALKKAGYKVESYKDEKTGARTYRINQ